MMTTLNMHPISGNEEKPSLELEISSCSSGSQGSGEEETEPTAAMKTSQSKLQRMVEEHIRSEEEKPKQKQNFQVSAATRREPGDPGEQGFEQQKIIS